MFLFLSLSYRRWVRTTQVLDVMNQNIECVHPVGDGQFDLPTNSPSTWFPLVALGFCKTKYLQRLSAKNYVYLSACWCVCLPPFDLGVTDERKCRLNLNERFHPTVWTDPVENLQSPFSSSQRPKSLDIKNPTKYLNLWIYLSYFTPTNAETFRQTVKFWQRI